MARRRSLVAVSRAQLAAQLAGLAVALRRKRYYDVGFMRGSAEHIARDAVWSGTAYSAPAYMLVDPGCGRPPGWPRGRTTRPAGARACSAP